MKKLLILIAIFASLLTCFFACSDDNPERHSSTGDPIYYHPVIGELTNDIVNGVFYFRAIECDDTYVLRELGVLPIPIYKSCAERQRDIFLDNLGYVQLNVAYVHTDSIDVSFVKPVDALSKGINECSTPEFDTPLPAWFFEPESITSSDTTK